MWIQIFDLGSVYMITSLVLVYNELFMLNFLYTYKLCTSQTII